MFARFIEVEARIEGYKSKYNALRNARPDTTPSSTQPAGEVEIKRLRSTIPFAQMRSLIASYKEDMVWEQEVIRLLMLETPQDKPVQERAILTKSEALMTQHIIAPLLHRMEQHRKLLIQAVCNLDALERTHRTAQEMALATTMQLETRYKEALAEKERLIAEAQTSLATARLQADQATQEHATAIKKEKQSCSEAVDKVATSYKDRISKLEQEKKELEARHAQTVQGLQDQHKAALETEQQKSSKLGVEKQTLQTEFDQARQKAEEKATKHKKWLKWSVGTNAASSLFFLAYCNRVALVYYGSNLWHYGLTLLSTLANSMHGHPYLTGTGGVALLGVSTDLLRRKSWERSSPMRKAAIGFSALAGSTCIVSSLHAAYSR